MLHRLRSNVTVLIRDLSRARRSPPSRHGEDAFCASRLRRQAAALAPNVADNLMQTAPNRKMMSSSNERHPVNTVHLQALFERANRGKGTTPISCLAKVPLKTLVLALEGRNNLPHPLNRRAYGFSLQISGQAAVTEQRRVSTRQTRGRQVVFERHGKPAKDENIGKTRNAPTKTISE